MVTREEVLEALKQVYDPEIPVNVVDLGLIYNIQIDEENQVYVEMTLTAPGCPMYGPIGQQAEAAIRRISGVKDAVVNFVWDPPWEPSKISDEGKKVLRSFGFLI